MTFMELKIFAIRDPGNLQKERILFRANKDCDLGTFVVLDDTPIADGKNNERLSYLFPRKAIKLGDWVRLYTCQGDASVTPAETKEPEPGRPGSGRSIPLRHNFYWGLDAPLWNRGGDAALLLKIAGQSSFSIGDDKEEK
jgi:hypothetical protein